MTFSEGWQDQYNRMLRSHQRLVEATNPVMSADEARDRLYHFFQDAYNLKDWLKKDPSTAALATAPPTVEALFTNPAQRVLWLQLCADLCNGVKHLVLDRNAKTGDRQTAFTSESTGTSISLGLPVFETYADFGTPQPREASESVTATTTYTRLWKVASNNQTFDAMTVADEVLVAWDGWLKIKSLL